MRIDIPNVHGSGEKWLDVMKVICGDTSDKSVVDLMCHHSPYVPQLGFKNRLYVDALDRGLDFIEEQPSFLQSDVFDFLSECQANDFKYDFLICSDGVEHFRITDAFYLLENMQEVGRSQVLFTPLGEHLVEVIETYDPDSHKCGLTPEIIENTLPDFYAYIVMPNFHGDVGAFFFFHTPNLKQEFERIYNELKQKEWTGLS